VTPHYKIVKSPAIREFEALGDQGWRFRSDREGDRVRIRINQPNGFLLEDIDLGPDTASILLTALLLLGVTE
jgi:hypothetical protein